MRNLRSLMCLFDGHLWASTGVTVTSSRNESMPYGWEFQYCNVCGENWSKITLPVERLFDDSEQHEKAIADLGRDLTLEKIKLAEEGRWRATKKEKTRLGIHS